MSDLTFYTNPMSRGRIARWMLEEVGEPYDTVLLEFGTTMKAPEYLAINPMGKVPAIRHGDTVVTEYGAVCAYLADAFPAAGLAPPVSSPERGSYLRWLFFACGPFDHVASDKSMGWVPDTPETRGRFGYGSMEDVLDAIDGWISNRDYVTGDTFSAADVVLGSGLSFGMMFKTIAPRPSFLAYTERLMARPAAIRASEIDDALMAEAQG